MTIEQTPDINRSPKTALQIVFDNYYSGIYSPENKAEADIYLLKASEMNHEWAMRLVALWSENSNPV
ncbi:MAG: hypothetical protein KAJ07_00040 [Planctomycetes bacterium]|nr:hypothetical protein [Planctomycetota bacterium]